MNIMTSCPLIRLSGTLHRVFTRHEKILFALLLVISIVPLWLTRYVPSLDGPQHLYNAGVLSWLIRGNELVGQFFEVNEVLVGYWSGHFFLTFFRLFLPAWLAEKFFLTAYVVAMAFSFRYLVRSINPARGNFVSFLIFPFIFHNYLALGYYSFSIAAIFFFMALGFWFRRRDRLNLKNILIFAGWSLGVFLSHALVFVFFCFAFAAVVTGTELHRKITGKHGYGWGRVGEKVWKAALALLPALVLWVIYIRSVMSISGSVEEAGYTFNELIKFLLRIRQLVGFHHERESVAYIPLFGVIFILCLGFLVEVGSALRGRTMKWADLLSEKNSWILAAAIFLGLYLFAPDRISAGSLTNRFGLWFFLTLIAFLSFQRFAPTLQVITLVVVLFSVSYARVVHLYFYRQLNTDIREIEQLEQYMEPNSVVYSLRSSPNWIHLHFPLYAAMDDPRIHLKNPQCRGQFPVVWNQDELPRTFAGDREVHATGSEWVSGPNHPERQVDYITVFYRDRWFADSTNAEWFEVLDTWYRQAGVSENGKAAVYERKEMD